MKLGRKLEVRSPIRRRRPTEMTVSVTHKSGSLTTLDIRAETNENALVAIGKLGSHQYLGPLMREFDVAPPGTQWAHDEDDVEVDA